VQGPFVVANPRIELPTNLQLVGSSYRELIGGPGYGQPKKMRLSEFTPDMIKGQKFSEADLNFLRDQAVKKKDIKAYVSKLGEDQLTENMLAKFGTPEAKQKTTKSEFDLSAFDPTTVGKARFGQKDLEYLQGKGVSDEEIRKYATSLDPSAVGRGVRELYDIQKASQGQGAESVAGAEQKPKKAKDLLETTIRDVVENIKVSPKSEVTSTPIQAGGAQVINPSVIYGGAFAPEISSKISGFEGGLPEGARNLNVRSTVNPQMQNIGNIEAGVRNASMGRMTQETPVRTTMSSDVMSGEIERLLRKASKK
jgi:hypothetical protein